jgi:hypothetical protein
MGFLDMVQSVGGRLGIIEKPAARGAAGRPAKIRTRSVTLEQLKTEIHAEEIQALAEAPAELTVPFEKIFETAGLPRLPSGWSIDRFRELLETEPFKGKARETIQSRILEALSKDKVAAEDLVKDAVARDQALDAFEKFAERKMRDRLALHERELSEVEAKIAELHKESSRLRQLAEADGRSWGDWLKRKRAHERELARVVGHLIDRPVITTDE